MNKAELINAAAEKAGLSTRRILRLLSTPPSRPLRRP